MEIKCKFKQKGLLNTFDCYVVSGQVLVESKWNDRAFFTSDEIMAEGDEAPPIKAIYFKNGVMKKLPKRLSEICPAIELLSVRNCGLEEISKSDLSGFGSLRTLSIENNELITLPNDLFEDNPEISWVSFKGNKLLHIGPNILDPLKTLKTADFRGNLRINYEYCLSLYDLIKDQHKDGCHLTHRSFKKLQRKIRKMEPFELRPRSGLDGDVKHLLTTDNLKDFTICIDGNQFKVHKLLIAARSPAINNLMKQNPQSDKIVFKDIPTQTFELILDFVYDDKLPAGDYFEVYAAAAKLQIAELKEFSADKLATMIGDENALKILTAANEYKSEELKVKAFEHIRTFFPDKTLRAELADNPEHVKKIIAAKKEIEKLVDNK